MLSIGQLYKHKVGHNNARLRACDSWFVPSITDQLSVQPIQEVQHYIKQLSKQRYPRWANLFCKSQHHIALNPSTWLYLVITKTLLVITKTLAMRLRNMQHSQLSFNRPVLSFTSIQIECMDIRQHLTMPLAKMPQKHEPCIPPWHAW